MGATKQPAVGYDVQLMAEDMATKGWLKADLAKRAGVSPMAVARFLGGEFQTAPMAKKLAKALGCSVRRYIVSGSHEAVA